MTKVTTLNLATLNLQYKSNGQGQQTVKFNNTVKDGEHENK